MIDLHPPIEPYRKGMLEVGEGNAVYFEECGTPSGRPALVLHGGPGQGTAPGMRRAFDPAKYRVVVVDQRGCGRSTPHASDTATDMRFNTTAHLVRDLETLRAHLEIDRWVLVGASWGATLALAYAEAHPTHVSAIVLSSITTSSARETEWLYGGLQRFFPEAWEAFASHVGDSRVVRDILAGYARVLDRGTQEARVAAARAWCTWEDATLSFEEGGAPFSAMPERDMLALVRICAHFGTNTAWLEDDELVRDARVLAQIPGVLIHGRRDMTCPIETAWRLARAWPGAELVTVEDAGHLRSDAKRRALLAALDRFTR